MNRSEQLHHVAFLEALADEARDEAKTLRWELEAQARAELADTGTAPTWRDRQIGSATLPVTKPRVVVDSEPLLLEYVTQQHPGQVQTVRRVRQSWLPVFLAATRLEDGAVVDGLAAVGEDGKHTPVPGLRYVEGGEPGALRLTVARDAKDSLRGLARGCLDRLFDREPKPEEVTGDEAR